ncbi:MAG: M23 family metallopeptidase [Spirochaetes bacterium]|nr:M23 family metallopeptidase [Spirochaetota bacterium]
MLDDLLATHASATGLEEQFWGRQCILLAQKIRSEAEAALESREQAIRLLSCADGAGWYKFETGRDLSAGLSVGEALALDRNESAGAYLLARARRELAGLARWEQLQVSGLPAGLETSADHLAYALRTREPGLDSVEAGARAASLEKLIAFLAGGLDLAARREELRGLLRGELWLAGFVGGQGCFMLLVAGNPIDCNALGMSGEWKARERAAGLFDSWLRYADSAPGLASERVKEGREALAAVLGKADLLEPGGDGAAGALRLKSPSALAGALPVADARGREEWLSNLAADLRRVEALLPGWLSEQVQAWFAELVSSAAAAAARGGPHPAAESTAEAAGSALDSLGRELEQIGGLRGQLADATDPIVGLADLFERLKGAVPGTGALGGAAAAGLTAEAVADRLTRAAAVSVASRVLASGEDPGREEPWDAAFSACFLGASRSPAELKQSIVGQARELLGIQRALDGLTPLADMTATERRAYVYALWNSGAIERIGIGLDVSQQADAIYGLRALVDRGANEGEIDAWETGLPDDGARAAVRLVRERLASSLPEQRDSVFLSALLAGEPGAGDQSARELVARIEECRRLAPVGGAVLERALCLELASQLGGPDGEAILGLIQSLAGLESHGAIDAAAFGNGDYDVQRAAFSGLAGGGLAPDAFAYFIKKTALAGEEVSELTAGLEGSLRGDVDRFLAFLGDLRGYLRGVDENEESYALGLPGARDADDTSSYISALRTGIWDDPIFTASLGAGGEPSGFLDALFALETGGLGRGATLIGLAGEYLAGLAQTFTERHFRLAAVKAYRDDYEAALASAAEEGGGSYREYLVSGNLTAKKAEDSLASALAAGPDLTDAGNVAHCESSDPFARSLENGALEAHNRLSRAGAALEASFAADGEADAAERESVEAFVQAMVKFTRVEDPVSVWAEADGMPVPAEIIVGFASARGALESTLNAIRAAQAEIARLGSALETWRSSADAEPDSASVREARERFEAAQGELQLAIEEFRSASEAYDTIYRAARGASTDLETARFERDKQQEIHEYAASGYLRGSGDETSGAMAWRSPAQQLERVKDRRDRARAALAALEGAIDAGQIARSSTDGEYLEAVDAYRDALERYLSFKKTQGDLVAEIARQEAVVEEKEGELSRIASEIMRGDSSAYTSEDPLVTAAGLESVLDPDSSDNEYNGLAIAYFCRLEDGARLRLAYDPASYAFQKNTDWTALKEYMLGETEGGEASEGSTFQEELRQWIVDMDALLGGSSDPTAVLARWGLAAGYVKQRLHAANEGSADIAAQTAGKAFAGGAAAEMVDADQYLRAFLSTNHDQTLDLDCTAFIRQEGERALAALSGRERELFRFYLAMDALGGTAGQGASFFRDSSMLAVWKYLEQKLSESAAAHASKGRSLAEIGAALWTAGILLNIFPGAGIPVLLQATFVLGMAVYEQNEAQKYAPIIAGARSRLSGEGSYGAIVAGSASNLAADIGSGNDALARLLSEQAALAGLKGSGWNGKPAEGEFVQALARMYAADLDPALRASISRYFDGVDPLTKTPSDILSAMIRASDRDRIAAAQALESEERQAREEQAAAMEEYRSALKALLEGGGTPGTATPDTSALARSAAAAFAQPAFVEEGHGRALYDLQAELGLAPAATGNGEYEAARREVLAGLKESLASLYQQRLQALAEVRQAEWALKEEDLARARAAWGEKMNLLVSRGMSEWKESDGRFKAELAQWRTGFADEYRRKNVQWSEVLLGFQEAKKGWVDDTALEAARVGNESILAEVGQAASARAREMASRIVTGISYEPPDGERLLARLIPGETLGAVLEGARQSADRIASAGITVSRGLGLNSGFASSLALIRGFLTEESEELAKRGVLIVADQASESLQEAREGYRELVQEANEGFEAGMDRMFIAAGYAKGAGRYGREGIIGSTVLSGTVTERQEVAGFTPFPVPGFEVKAGLEAEALAGLSAEGIHARLSIALEELEDQREEIFGPDDETDAEKAARKRSFLKKDFSIDEDDGFLGEMWEGVTSIFGEKEFGYTQVEQSWGAGAFGAHIGYAPVFVGAPDPDKGYAENILEPGGGQLDHLVGWYGYYEMRVGKGLGELNAPVYDKPLWNDEGGFVEAPTLRTVVDIGVSIAATLTGNVWVAAALSLTDDALFGLADVAGGYKEGSAVALEFGKKAVVGFGTAAIGGLLGTNDAFGKAFGFDAWLGIGEKNVIGQTLLAGTQAVTSNAFSGAVNAISYSDQGGWGWDSRVFAGSLVSRQAFAGYVGQTVSRAIGVTLAGATDKFTEGLATLAGGLGGEAARWTYYLAAESIGNSDGLSAGQLAARALDDMGGLTLNVANLGALLDMVMLAQEGQGDFSASQYAALSGMADRLAQTGLLELTIGTSGASLALGTGGVDLGGSLYGMGKAALLSTLVSSYTGSEGLKEAMRQAYGKGDYAAEATIWRVLAGTDRIVEGDPDGARARTESDSYGSRTILLGSTGGGRWDALDAAVRLQHESWRNGVADSANGQETFAAVLAHTRMARALGDRNRDYLASDGGLLAEVRLLDRAEQAGSLDIFRLYAGTQYDSSEDFWRLVQQDDGSHALEFDARAEIYDENNNFLVGTGSLAVQGALAEYLGLTGAEAEQLMSAAGMTMDTEGMWNKSTIDLNLGQRIAIAEASDPLLSSYLFAAYHQNQALDEIAAVVSQNGQTMSRTAMREYLKENVPVWQEIDDSYIARYQTLRNSLIDFYLGSGKVDEQQVDISQLFGLADATTQDLYQYHTGIDSLNGPWTELLAAWSGRVERSSWSDSIGNVVEVIGGYPFEGNFLSAGFSYGNAHLMDRIASEGQLVDWGALLGRSGNTGSQVIGQNGGYHNHFTIYDSGYGTNRYLSSMLGLGDSSVWTNAAGSAWTYQYEPHDRRYYNPEQAYTAWFRKR